MELHTAAIVSGLILQLVLVVAALVIIKRSRTKAWTPDRALAKLTSAAHSINTGNVSVFAQPMGYELHVTIRSTTPFAPREVSDLLDVVNVDNSGKLCVLEVTEHTISVAIQREPKEHEEYPTI